MPFDLVEPESLDEALALLDPDDPAVRPVAVILAESVKAAEEGCRSILAEYGELPAVTDEVEAAGSAVHVHDALRPAGAFQCGFCTPGFVPTAKQLLDENPDPSEEDIRHYLGGNLCRCGSYPQIVEAVRIAAARRRAAAFGS